MRYDGTTPEVVDLLRLIAQKTTGSEEWVKLDDILSDYDEDSGRYIKDAITFFCDQYMIMENRNIRQNPSYILESKEFQSETDDNPYTYIKFREEIRDLANIVLTSVNDDRLARMELLKY